VLDWTSKRWLGQPRAEPLHHNDMRGMVAVQCDTGDQLHWNPPCWYSVKVRWGLLSMEPVLQATELTKRFASVAAVKDVSFSLAPGQVLGCLGPNGSGKSTTVKMLTGLLEPSRGKVLFGGENIQKDLVGYRKQFGYVPEEPNLYPYLTGREYLEMVGLLRGMSSGRLGRKIDALLELFAMHPNRHSPIGSYSKGMRQRILLVAALMDDPHLLIFDEPLSGLDVTSALVLKNLIKALGQRGKTIFYCSHVLEVVEQVCSHLLILRKGIVVAYGTTEAIHNDIQHSSLERTFMHLVEEVDTEKIAEKIIGVMETT
jgi:ABC-2 type transport system ATP-binding protein